MESSNIHEESTYAYGGQRKNRKLLAEKRRRTRINQNLLLIKDMVCGRDRNTDPNWDKMEKAAILESTLDHLRSVRKITNVQQQTKRMIQFKFQQGFVQCAEELLAYLQSVSGVSDRVQLQLQKHMKRRVWCTQGATNTLQDGSRSSIRPRLPTETTYLHTDPVPNSYSTESSVPRQTEDSLSPISSRCSASAYHQAQSNPHDSLRHYHVSSTASDNRVREWLEHNMCYSPAVTSPWRPW